jgi:predicted phosphohydrolase
MRLIAVADTHLCHDELTVPDGDVFIHAGDICRRGTLAELERAAAWIRALPHRFKVVIAGNHDWSFAEDAARSRALLGDGVLYLQDSGVTVEGLRFWGSPWQPEFGRWAFNLPRGVALAEKWARIPEGLDVLVTHGPPEGIGDLAHFNGHTGCADLLARVRVARPRLHLFGHIHEDGGAWTVNGTTFVNCTTAGAHRAPTVIDVEPGGGVRVLAPPERGAGSPAELDLELD